MESEKYFLYVQDGVLIIQESEYIEHGWFVMIVGKEITLYEIPIGGGEQIFIDKFYSVNEAIESGKNLT